MRWMHSPIEVESTTISRSGALPDSQWQTVGDDHDFAGSIVRKPVIAIADSGGSRPGLVALRTFCGLSGREFHRLLRSGFAVIADYVPIPSGQP